ncbi:MAG: hypothetical protein WKF30_00845 [Pyrinomonadaceae bacterium]
MRGAHLDAGLGPRSTRSFFFYLAAGWALATFLLPQVNLPLYVAARLLSPGPRGRGGAERRRTFAHWALPLIYAALILTTISIVYWRDSNTFDAHLERAGAAQLRGQHAEAAAEYGRALRHQPDAHTQKLLGRELVSDRRFGEALVHLRAAEAAHINDESIGFDIARSLDELQMFDEARTRYRDFLAGAFCTVRDMPDARCEIASERVAAIGKKNGR